MSRKAAVGEGWRWASCPYVWLEVTGKCQLRCTHCYAESGPSGTHGKMGTGDWLRVIDQTVGLGVKSE